MVLSLYTLGSNPCDAFLFFNFSTFLITILYNIFFLILLPKTILFITVLFTFYRGKFLFYHKLETLSKFTFKRFIISQFSTFLIPIL